MNFILDKEQFLKYQAQYKQLAHEKENSASDIILYNIIRGKPLQHGFTPATNAKKILGYGGNPWLKYDQKYHDLHYLLKYVRGNIRLKYKDTLDDGILDKIQGTL